MSLNSKLALIKRWSKIITGKNLVAIEQGVGKIYSIKEISGYYNDLTEKVNSKALLDENGIPVNKIVGDKIVYFPITIFQYALGTWDKFLLTKDEKFKKSFCNLSKWIITNQSEDGSWDCFTPIGHTKYSVSSMGQGEAISVLVRMYLLSEEKEYLYAAKKALEFMIKDVKNGGTMISEGENCIFEEYPNINEKNSSVLNGWIFSLFGIYDYLKIENDKEIRLIFEKSVKTLAKNLQKYDMGYWTYYDRIGRVASPAYHSLHIALLQVMYEITNIYEFKEYKEKWEKYKMKDINRNRAILRKAIQKLSEKSEGVIIE